MKIKVSAYLWAESFIQEIFTGHLVLSELQSMAVSNK